jgi:hypothetical protein
MPVPLPPGVQCPKWEPASTGSKRCRYYIDPGSTESVERTRAVEASELTSLAQSGLCRLPDEFVCVEWTRRFGTDEQRAALHLRAYPARNEPPGPPADPDAPPPLALAVQDRPPAKVIPIRPTPPAMARGAPLVALHGVEAFEPAREVDPAGVEALERAGAEVEVDAPFGKITLVPSRTGRADRVEVTFRESAVIRMLVDSFRGAHVVGFRSGDPTRGAAVVGPGTPSGTPRGALVDSQRIPAPTEPIYYPPGTPTGSTCGVCGEIQESTGSSWTCRNGHVGAAAIEDEVDPFS